MSLHEKIQTLSQLVNIIQTLNSASVSNTALNNSVNVLAVDIFNLVNKDATTTALGQSVAGAEGSPAGDKQTVNTKKETAPKSTKKVTAADIVEAATGAQEKAFKQSDIPPEVVEEVVEEVSLTDDEPEEPLTGETIDYVELRTECRALINSAVDRVGKPAVVAILDYIHAKSLKDVKDNLLPWLRTKLTEAK